MPNMHLVLVDEQERAEHLLRLPFDQLDDVLEDSRSGSPAATRSSTAVCPSQNKLLILASRRPGVPEHCRARRLQRPGASRRAGRRPRPTPPIDALLDRRHFEDVRCGAGAFRMAWRPPAQCIDLASSPTERRFRPRARPRRVSWGRASLSRRDAAVRHASDSMDWPCTHRASTYSVERSRRNLSSKTPPTRSHEPP